jgi:hypothetical protein
VPYWQQVLIMLGVLAWHAQRLAAAVWLQLMKKLRNSIQKSLSIINVNSVFIAPATVTVVRQHGMKCDCSQLAQPCRSRGWVACSTLQARPGDYLSMVAWLAGSTCRMAHMLTRAIVT